MSTAGEIQFPEPILQRLQSFLTRKEAARTTIVSKSWHSAWSTRPNLYLDDSNLQIRSSDYAKIDDFSKHAKKTIKRYEQSNLKIESFTLCMQMNWYGRGDLAHKLIAKALKIGATRLSFRVNDHKRSHEFVFPHEVVFGADNLVGLSVKGCKINPDNDPIFIRCSRLESLSLDEVVITGDMVSNIISSCPMIEKLSLDFNIYPVVTAATDSLVNNLGRLRCLVLGSVSFERLFSGDDLLSKFPFLTDFTLYLKHSDTSRSFEKEVDIKISNCSLECIKLELEDDQTGQMQMDSGWGTAPTKKCKPRVKFDVPSIRKFTFEGEVMPSLSFISTSREWESHVFMNCQEHSDLTASWFGELSEFLTMLRQSKTHLSLRVANSMYTSFDYEVRDTIIQGLRKHELESLAIDMTGLTSLSCYAIFDGLFRLCRPKLITQYHKEEDPEKERRYDEYHYDPTPDNETRKTNNIDFLCQTLEEGMSVKVSRPSEYMYGLNDLEEVNAQVFDVEWRPIPLESLLDIADEQEHQRVRLLLKWKPN